MDATVKTRFPAAATGVAPMNRVVTHSLASYSGDKSSTQRKHVPLPLSLIRLLVLILILAGCGGGGAGNGGGGAGNAISVTGTLGSTFRVSATSQIWHSEPNRLSNTPRTPGNYVVQSSVDTVTAVPIDRPFVNRASIFQEAVSVPIDENGSFSITLTTQKDWILLLIDSLAPRKEQIKAYAGLGDTFDNLILMPLTGALGDIDLGTLEGSGDEAVSDDSMTLNEENFSLGLDELREIAKNDHLLKTIGNLYVNFNAETGASASVLMGFNWRHTGTGNNVFTDPQDYFYEGLWSIFEIDSLVGIDFDGVVTQTKHLSIIPPTPVYHQNHDGTGEWFTIFENTGNMTVDDASVGDGTLWANSDDNPFTIGLTTETGDVRVAYAGNLSSAIPPGWWVVEQDLVEMAAFDIGIAMPFVTETMIPTVYMPSVKVETDADNTIQRFVWKWLRYNFSTGQYEELTDIGHLATEMEWVGIYMDAVADGRAEILDIDSVTMTEIIPTNFWKGFGDTSAADFILYDITIGYRIWGVDFSVRFQ